MRITIHESQFEEGYDSDGQLGPFYDAVIGEEVEGYYEEAIEVVQAAVPVSDASNDESNEMEVEVAVEEDNDRRFTMSDDIMVTLNKKYLVEQCTLLGLNPRGNKGPSIERLKKAREDKRCFYQLRRWIIRILSN